MYRYLIAGLMLITLTFVACRKDTPVTAESQPGCSTAKSASTEPQYHPQVVMVIAPQNFRDEEYFVPKKIFTASGIKVLTAASTKDECTGMFGGKVKPDLLLTEVKVPESVAIIFVGGNGARIYFDNPQALSLAKETITEAKILGAICLAPVILAKAGVLKDKKATVFYSEKIR